MRWTRRLVVLLAATLWVPAAAAQTTSSTTSTTSLSTTSSTSTSTSTSTTTSTVVVIDDACVIEGGCSVNEPIAVLAAASGTQEAVYGGSCWRIVPPSQFPAPIRCTSVLLADPFPRAPLVVRPGETLTLRFEPPIRPSEVTIWRSATITDQATPLFTAPAQSPTTFAANFPTGDSIVLAMVRFSQGLVPYHFAVTVRPLTTATDAPIAFTG